MLNKYMRFYNPEEIMQENMLKMFKMFNKIMAKTHPEYRGEPIRVEKKLGRNQKCPCNSGRKFKHCCIDKKTDITIIESEKDG